MAANDVYSVTVNGSAFGNAVINVFFYKADSGSGSADSEELRAVWRSGVEGPMCDILSNQYGLLSIDTLNLFDNSDFENWITGSVIDGNRTGEAAPNFVVVKFKSAKPTSSQQPARKAFSPLSENDINGGIVNSGTYSTTNLTALATVLGQDLVGGAGSIFTPVIVKRIPYTTTGGNPAYRLPASLGESVTFPATSWTWDTSLSPQATRKLGRGI